ncbi:hypothetical protein BU26DRAFT_525747 [Trematosphaeria pertusa]|uniref:Uncharacterized protein n=1 Tax=Trematosphaeria pertusa TaxID=390896 RepID=A0A6A6HS69_9PLEO|nr:uncharacterized protein BU26DRAFT_525747 [Trematosphaeria pertusa]KAF2240847.1 hypothetical protein BU26DRAFT_525747 [Trematosphaeria pertusa]
MHKGLHQVPRSALEPRMTSRMSPILFGFMAFVHNSDGHVVFATKPTSKKQSAPTWVLRVIASIVHDVHSQEGETWSRLLPVPEGIQKGVGSLPPDVRPSAAQKTSERMNNRSWRGTNEPRNEAGKLVSIFPEKYVAVRRRSNQRASTRRSKMILVQATSLA